MAVGVPLDEDYAQATLQLGDAIKEWASLVSNVTSTCQQGDTTKYCTSLWLYELLKHMQLFSILLFVLCVLTSPNSTVWQIMSLVASPSHL